MRTKKQGLKKVPTNGTHWQMLGWAAQWLAREWLAELWPDLTFHHAGDRFDRTGGIDIWAASGASKAGIQVKLDTRADINVMPEWVGHNEICGWAHPDGPPLQRWVVLVLPRVDSILLARIEDVRRACPNWVKEYGLTMSHHGTRGPLVPLDRFREAVVREERAHPDLYAELEQRANEIKALGGIPLPG